MDQREQQEAKRVGDDVALAALDLLSRVIACNSTSFRSFTLWLSMTPADGLASLPSGSRATITRRWLIVANSARSRHA
jgi:hypothetical protein